MLLGNKNSASRTEENLQRRNGTNNKEVENSSLLK